MIDLVEPMVTSGAWGIVWKQGEPSVMENSLWVLEMLDKMPQPESAKIFQGTENGAAVTYVAYKYRK